MYNDPNAPYGQQPGTQPPYGQTPYSSPYEQQYTQSPYEQAAYPSTQYGAPQPMQPMPPVYVAPPPKSSAKAVWIVLGILGAIFLLVGGGCCAIVTITAHTAGQSMQTFGSQLNATVAADHQTVIADESSPSQEAESYYLAISVQDYSGAYVYLAPTVTLNGTSLTQASFTQQAQALDASEGKVTNYSATADPGDPSNVTVQVSRETGKTYTVHLTFSQGNYQWVISSFDTI